MLQVGLYYKFKILAPASAGKLCYMGGIAERKVKRIFKRVFFCFVSVVLVCCMLFNMATPKAQAVAIVDDIAIGITALLLLAAAGVVFTPKDSDGIAAIGNSFKSSMYQWGTSAEKLDEVEEWFTDLVLYQPSDPGDEGDEDPRYQVRLARGILAGITTWMVSVIAAGLFEVEVEIPEDYASFNGLVLPFPPSGIDFDENPYMFLGRLSNSDVYTLYAFSSLGNLVVEDTSSGFVFRGSRQDVLLSYSSFDGLNWSPASHMDFTGSTSTKPFGSYFSELIWSNFSLTDYSSGDVVLDASELEFTVNSSLESSVVGDLPDQIQNGEKDADDIILPGVIDYGSLIQDGMTLEESVIDTMTQLSDGTLSHQTFLDNTMVAEQPVFTQNLPVTDDMAYAYAVGEQADTFTVAASGNADGSGTLTYEWLDTSTVPYTVLGTGQSYTPDTSQVADYSLACRVTNTVPCSFVESGYVTNSAYSWTYHITVSDTVVDPPGSDTETDEDKDTAAIVGSLDRIEGLLNPDTDALLDSSQALQNSMDVLDAFEQTQLDGLQNNKHVITDAFKIFGEGSTLLSAFNLVTYIVNGTYNSLGAYQVVITLPVVLGIFLFICSRVRGFDKPRKNNPGYRSSQAKVSAAAGGNDPKSPEV